MLIKDPYLESNVKNRSFSNHVTNTYNPQNNNAQNTSSFQCENTNTQNIIHNSKYLSQPFNNQKRERERFVSAYEPLNVSTSQGNHNQTIQNLKNKLYQYENQIKKLTEGYKNQANVFQKVNSYQAVNKEYHEAMKCRNFQLNTKVTDLQYQKALIHKRNQEQMLRNSYDKENFIKKYEEQTEQIINSKRTINQLIQQKVRLQEQVSHLMFLLQKDNHQGSLEIKEQLIRMENMQRTLKGVINTKDQEIGQLRNRLRVYQDQNKRLNDLSKTLAITTKDKIENLSKIQNMDSNMKSLNKQNFDHNHKNFDYLSQLKQQKHVNERLQNQINQMKKRLFQNLNQKNGAFDKKGSHQNQHHVASSQMEDGLNKLKEFRALIVKHLFDVFCKSVKDGQRQRRNSLVIFIQNWKTLDMSQINKHIKQYMNERDKLKAQIKNKGVSADPMLKTMIQECLPLKIAAKSRNQVNQWILSTIQYTKNQKYESQMKSTGNSITKRNNYLLFLFRLLTIEYRVKYPMQGKGYNLDLDVKNQLHHTIVKALLDNNQK